MRKSGEPRTLTRANDVTPPAIDFVPPPEPWPGWPAGWATGWEGAGDSYATKSAVVFRCVDMTANGIATLPLGQYLPDLTEQEQPAAWMHNPEPDLYTSRREAICAIITSSLMRGNTYIYVTSRYFDGYPRTWVVLNPDKVNVQADRNGLPVYTVDAYRVPREDICHLKHQTRPGELLGIGPLQACYDNLFGISKAQGYANDLVGKDLMPYGALIHPEEQSKTQSQELRQAWEETPGLVRVLSGGLDFKSLGLSPSDVQLLERMDFDARCIATAFGIPAPMLNLAMQGAGLHYSSSDMDLRALWQLTFNPIADNVERALSEMLPGNQTVRFDEYGFLAGAFSEQVTAAVQLVNAGIWLKNEARTKFNLPEIAGLDDKQEVPQALQDFQNQQDPQQQDQQAPPLQVVNNA